MTWLVAVIAMAFQPAVGPGVCNHARMVADATLHTAPDVGSTVRPLHRLRKAMTVYTCDEFQNDDRTERWVQIMFADDTHRCPGTANGLEYRQRASCRSGWVRDDAVEVLSG